MPYLSSLPATFRPMVFYQWHDASERAFFSWGQAEHKHARVKI